jgi:hypothetical protein
MHACVILNRSWYSLGEQPRDCLKRLSMVLIDMPTFAASSSSEMFSLKRLCRYANATPISALAFKFELCDAEVSLAIRRMIDMKMDIEAN